MLSPGPAPSQLKNEGGLSAQHAETTAHTSPGQRTRVLVADGGPTGLSRHGFSDLAADLDCLASVGWTFSATEQRASSTMPARRSSSTCRGFCSIQASSKFKHVATTKNRTEPDGSQHLP